MAKDSPNSFRDPYWSDLARQAEQKHGITPGLLVSVLTNGERSNANQVSEKGAATVFQITPETRALILKRDGIDPYLNDRNAAEAAALVLKDGVNWAKGRAKDPMDVDRLASGYYHAGGDTANWGKKTDAYINRVMAGQQTTKASALDNGFAKFMAANPATPVNDPQPEAPADAKTDALSAGFGSWLGAQSGRASIPGSEEYDARAPAPDPTIGQQAVGLGEAGLTAVTGMTGGTLGAIKGGVQGLLDPKVTNIQQLEQSVQRGAESMTYAPRTEVGQERAQQLGDIASNLIPIAPLAPQMAAIRRAGQAARPTAQVLSQTVPQVARETAATAAQNVAAGARAIPERVGQMMGREAPAPTPGTMGSAGSAAVDIATQRKMAAQELPVPIRLTEGQATRDYSQQRFEGETAKDPDIGAPIRERFNEQNQKAKQNFETMIDSTGTQAPDSGRWRSVGIAVDKAIQDQLKRDKAEVNVKYATARKSDEAKVRVDQSAPVSIGAGDDALTSTPLQFINEQPTGIPASALSDAARQYAVKIGVADLDESGQLVPKPGATVSQMENWRAAINSAVGNDPAQVRQATILKRLIDGQTEPLAGPLYRDARNARARLAQNYEDRASINRLITNKPGTEDRRIAFEDVFRSSILGGSLDDVRNLRRVLHRSGEDGHQAWRDLQGATMAHLRDEAFGNMARDSTGNIIVSEAKLKNAVKHLEEDGKLDFVFGKRGAEQVRTLADVVSDLKNIAPGAVNTSNTASVLAGLFDVAATAGSGGVPLPVATGLRVIVNNIKDRRLRMRVAEALGDAKRKEAAKPKPIDGVNKKRTFH